MDLERPKQDQQGRWESLAMIYANIYIKPPSNSLILVFCQLYGTDVNQLSKNIQQMIKE
jgi:hypothetical protein